MASLFGNTSARRSSESQRSFAAVPSSPSSSRSTCPAKRLPNFVIMVAFLQRGELYAPRGEEEGQRGGGGAMAAPAERPGFAGVLRVRGLGGGGPGPPDLLR